MNPIVDTQWLAEHLHDPDLVIADVRAITLEPEAGRALYHAGRIPGAVFLDLDEDLADRSDLTRGRHPLPDPRVFVQKLARVGIGKGKCVVAYDDKAGSYAARLWWLLRWIGVQEVAVLDGGITKWAAEGRQVESGEPIPRVMATPYDPVMNTNMVVNMSAVAAAGQNHLLLLDARSAERFRGELEPIDARAGHIPGAVNAPWENNITPDTAPVMKPADALHEQYWRLGVTSGSTVICYCGSGVTACHDILALELAGFPGAKLYPGSWSEWIAQSGPIG